MTALTATDTASAMAEVDAQGTLQPGEFGWWKVWGATPQDIRPGDLVRDTGDAPFLVQDTFTALSVARKGIVVEGERQTIGLLCPIRLYRRGTRHTLSPTAR